MIHRYVKNIISQWLDEKKVIVLYGPRQAGKTTLVREFLTDDESSLYVTGDIPRQVEWLASQDDRIYASKLGGITLLIIDEAQNINDIGMILKILYDLYKNTLHIIATGSSSFDLASKTQEPLTGRKITCTLLPFGIHELFGESHNSLGFDDVLPECLLYGMYPEIYLEQHSDKKRKNLTELTDAYLFKDILQFEGIKKSSTIIKLAKLLAYQIGKPVSVNELAMKLEIGRATVESYLTILEQAFVIFRLGSFSKNLRKELSKGQKIYFRDVGIRNSLIDMFAPLDIRADRGELRENFVIAEMMKKKLHTQQPGTYYFRRTYDDQEIDLIEVCDDQLIAYEIKRSRSSAKIPVVFTTTYPHAISHIITKDNFLDHMSIHTQ